MDVRRLRTKKHLKFHQAHGTRALLTGTTNINWGYLKVNAEYGASENLWGNTMAIKVSWVQ